MEYPSIIETKVNENVNQSGASKYDCKLLISWKSLFIKILLCIVVKVRVWIDEEKHVNILNKYHIWNFNFNIINYSNYFSTFYRDIYFAIH